MLIKSGATGEMVEARVGMVVKTDQFSGNFKNATIVELHDDKSATVTIPSQPISHRVWLNTCTLLHCPFQVGDLYEQPLDGEWMNVIGMVVMNETSAETMSEQPHEFRHANPLLRDSPEYKAKEAK